jgi:hypothetical protein
MKKQQTLLGFLMVTILFTLTLNSCKKEEVPFALGTLTAGTIDLNGLNSAINVPASPTISATFSTEVDLATAIPANITLVQSYDALSIPLTIAVSGKTITLTVENELASGAIYELTFTTGLKATNGLLLTAAIKRSFTTLGSFVPTGQIAYFNFENNANDQVGTRNPAASDIIDINYVTGRNAAAGKAALFNGNTSIIEIPRGDQLVDKDLTISLWLKLDTTSAKMQHAVFGCGTWVGYYLKLVCFGTGSIEFDAGYDIAGATSFTALWTQCNGVTKDNGGYMGWTYDKDLTATGGLNPILVNKWANLIIMYNAATKVGSIYLNGEKIKAQDFNLYDAPWPTAVGFKYGGTVGGGGDNLALGFAQGRYNLTQTWWPYYDNPYGGILNGQMDDLRFFNKVLTPTEITMMYNSEKP